MQSSDRVVIKTSMCDCILSMAVGVLYCNVGSAVRDEHCQRIPFHILVANLPVVQPILKKYCITGKTFFLEK